MRKRCTIWFLALWLTSPASVSFAADCGDYPFIQGLNVEDVNGGTRILSTAAVSVTFDDIDSVKDARDEATLEAKAQIAAFMSEGIQDEDTINKAVQETKSMQGLSKTTIRQELVERVKKLHLSSQGLLRGVVPLGECYTKSSELRVTVGIKPETIASAGKTAEGVAGSLTNPGSSITGTGKESAAPPSGNEQKLNGVDSYSNTDVLKKF